MKKILVVLALALAYTAIPASAQVVTNALSTTTACVPITVSSSVVTAMQAVVDSTTTAPGLPTTLGIENQDASNPIFCSGNAAVAISGATLGWSIAAAGSRDFTIFGWQQWYCLAKTASVQAEVCKTH